MTCLQSSISKRVWIGLFLFVLISFPVKTFALTLSPSRIETTGDPGQTITESIMLLNEGSKSETYYPSFANFEAQGESGTPTFVEPKDDLGTWMTVNTGSITLAPGESKEVSVSIAIPSGAEPGGHFAAVFWGTTPPGTSGAVSVGSKTGMLVLLSVSGAINESVGLLDFSTKGGQWLYRMLPVGFEYRFSNQGGDRIKPVGTIVVRSIFGWRVARVDANPTEGNVLPGTTRKFTPEWSKHDSVEAKEDRERKKYSFLGAVKSEWKNFAVGIFRAQLKTEFGTEEQRMKSNSVYFIVFPWELLVILIPGAYIIFRFVRFLLRRYNRSIIRKAQKRFANERNV